MTHEFNVIVEKNGWLIISDQVRSIVAASGVETGICLVSLPHTTAGLIITSPWDFNGLNDVADDLRSCFPARTNYRHQYSPFTSAARSRSAVTGNSATLIVRGGKLVLGGSQALIIMENDGPRERTVQVTVLAKELYYTEYSFVSSFGSVTDLTEQVCLAITQSCASSGICHVSNLSSTSGLIVCSPEAIGDFQADMERLIPARADFQHRETASDASGHIRSSIAGSQLHLPFINGEPILGERYIYYVEFDGPRRRNVCIAVYRDDQKGEEA